MRRLRSYLSQGAVDAAASRLRLHIHLPFAVILVCIVAILAVIYWSAQALDRFALVKSRDQLRYQLEENATEAGELLIEHTWWNESVAYTIYEHDQEWSDENVGVYLTSTYDMSGVVAFAPGGEKVYQYAAADAELPDNWERATEVVDHLIEQVLAGDPAAPVPASSYVDIEGALFLVIASPFAAYEPTRFDVDRFHGVLVVAKLVSDAQLRAWAEQYGLREIGVMPHDTGNDVAPLDAKLQITDAFGEPVSLLAWTPPRPGQDLIQQILPWSLVLVGVVGIASLFLLYKIRSLVLATRDYMVALDEKSSQLEEQATVDPVSGLYNRHYMNARIEEEIARVKREESSLIFMFIDLDGFKTINDTMGHAAGDRLLKESARRIKSTLRASDVLCRFGGDEFCVLVPVTGMPNKEKLMESADRIVAKLLQALDGSYRIDGNRVSLGASIGVVLCPYHTVVPRDVLRFADLTMYQAKSDGGSSYRFYGEPMLDRVKRRSILRDELRQAVAAGDFELYYQPICCTNAGKAVGFEALLRWQSRSLGWVSPAEFIPIAEETDLILDLGDLVLRRAVKDIRAYNDRWSTDAFVSINVSARELVHESYRERLQALLSAERVEPSLIWLEVTESHELEQTLYHKSLLQEIDELGVKIVLDDFGTGYSSFSYLQDLPISVLKIDKRFVHALPSKRGGEDVVRAIIYMADCLDMDVVAEGVEDREQEEVLVEMSCRFIQGYYRGHPAPLERYMSSDECAGTGGQRGQ